MKFQKTPWILALLFAILFFASVSPYKISILKSPTYIIQSSTESGQLKNVNDTEESTNNLILSEYLSNISKNTLERTDRWFSIMLNITFVVLAIIGIAFSIIAIGLRDKFHEIDILLTQAKKQKDDIQTELENIQKQAASRAPDTISQPPQAGTIAPAPNLSPMEQERLKLVKIAHFEQVYRLIFGSQLFILKILRGSPPDYNISRKNLELLHSKSNWSKVVFDDYINFLINNFLLGKSVENDTYYLTTLGAEFLQYLLDNGIPDKQD